jgi:Zn ribbon nucleic-acid-binding protein
VECARNSLHVVALSTWSWVALWPVAQGNGTGQCRAVVKVEMWSVQQRAARRECVKAGAGRGRGGGGVRGVRKAVLQQRNSVALLRCRAALHLPTHLL